MLLSFRNENFKRLIFICLFLIINLLFLSYEFNNSTIETQQNLEFKSINGMLNLAIDSNKSEPFQVSNAPAGKIAENPQIVIDKNRNIHIVWDDNSNGTYNIFYRIYNYSTQTWSNIFDLTQDSLSDCKNPSIGIDQDLNILVIWMNATDNYSIYGRLYNHSSSQWEQKNIIVDAGSQFIYDAKIAWAGDNNFTLVYSISDGTNRKIRSKNYYMSKGWEIDYLVSNETNVIDRYPDIYFDDKFNGHLVFRREIGGGYSIMYMNRTWNPYGGSSGTGDYEFGYNGIAVNVTSKLNFIQTYQADKPSVIANTNTKKIYISWQDMCNSSGTYQIKTIGMNLTNYINESLLDNQVTNVTMDSQKHTGILMAYGFNRDQVSLIWTEGVNASNTGNLYFKSSFGTQKEKFNPSLGNPIPIDSIMHDMVNDTNNNLYITYTENLGSSYQVMFILYDVLDPQLSIISPSDNFVGKGNLGFIVSTEPDTRTVKYEYYNDTNNNGIDDDGNIWELIEIVNSTTNNFNYIWNSTKNGIKDYYHILIRLNATDINGLSSVKILKNITLDNCAPQKVNIISIEDNSGVKVYNSSSGTVYLSGVVTITFDVFDNCTGINYVELYNGTNFIEDNITSGNSTSITINTTSIYSNMRDGNFSSLTIKAYDRVFNFQNSSIFPWNIIVDNKPPKANFTDIKEGDQFKDYLWINITSTDNDIKNITLYYLKNADPNINGTIGLMEFNSTEGKWMKYWDITSFSNKDGNYTIIAQIFDYRGFETNISIIVNIDYTWPKPIIIYPTEGAEVGTYAIILVQSDNDTKKVDLLYSKSQFENYSIVDTKFMNESKIEEGYRIFQLMLYTLNLIPGEFYYIKINATDGIYNNITDPFRIKISANRPGATRDLSGYYSYNIINKTYNITIFWKSPEIGQHANITNYYIYRVKYDLEIFSPSVNPFWLNNLTEDEKKAYLGDAVGVKYFVFNMSVEELGPTEEALYNWTDTDLSAGTYYYIILAVNILDYYSGINSVLEIIIPAESPTIKANKQLLQSIPILFVVTIILIGIMSGIFVKSSRNRRYRRQAKIKLEEMYEEKFTEKGEKTFEERLEQIEQIAEVSIKEETGIHVSEIEEKFAGESILDADVSKLMSEVKPTEVTDTGPKRCPNCNWIVSSTATKCPRCQKPLL